jgi:3-oxoacyl-[acyl-carrier-protein] synthase II
MRRIVVTGMGLVGPLGSGIETSWKRLLDGKSGIRSLPDKISNDLPVKIGESFLA